MFWTVFLFSLSWYTIFFSIKKIILITRILFKMMCLLKVISFAKIGNNKRKIYVTRGRMFFLTIIFCLYYSSKQRLWPRLHRERTLIQWLRWQLDNYRIHWTACQIPWSHQPLVSLHNRLKKLKCWTSRHANIHERRTPFLEIFLYSSRIKFKIIKLFL